MHADNIFIFTGAVRSGKTTALWHLVKESKNTGGFLTPDKDGLRQFYDVAGRA